MDYRLYFIILALLIFGIWFSSARFFKKNLTAKIFIKNIITAVVLILGSYNIYANPVVDKKLMLWYIIVLAIVAVAVKAHGELKIERMLQSGKL